VSDKVIVMDNAVIAQEGTPSDLYARPRTRFLADFIGEANLVDGEFSEKAKGIEFKTGNLALPLGSVPLPENAKTLAVRPDRVDLLPDAAGTFTIRRVAYVGASHEYVVDAPWGEMLVIRPVRDPVIAVGTKVSIRIDPGAAIALPG
jgi:iron(III) transport system ATP-binding protein